MADQSASLFGSCCFKPGDAKLTMGTGTFFNINTGGKPHASTLGLYPLIAWKVGCNMVHMVEGNNGDTGTLILWALSSGLADKPEDTGDMALSVSNSDGVYFIPSFTGLGAPVNDSTAAAGFIGVKMTTKKEHLVRSVLEAISFRSAQLSRCIKQETNYTFDKIRFDGGVSQNNFVGQLISDVTGLTLERTSSAEVSARGCAFLAGLTSGVWQSHEEVAALCHGDNLFVPRDGVGKIYGEEMQKWESAVNRFKEWYKKEKTPKFANISKFCCNRSKKREI